MRVVKSIDAEVSISTVIFFADVDNRVAEFVSSKYKYGAYFEEES